MGNLFENPFAVQSPEDIPADAVVDLFVDVFTDFYHVRNPGHTFLHGPRGSGKSMMFRYMLPDCRRLVLEKPLNKHDYFAIYIPIKGTDLRLTELGRLQKHATLLLNEHILTMNIATRAFMAFTKINIEATEKDNALIELRNFYTGTFIKRLQHCGWLDDIEELSSTDEISDVFNKMMIICEKALLNVIVYLKKIALTDVVIPYENAICSYLDFLFPVLKGIRNMKFMSDGPIYLLIDDADNLSELQTQILNNWVSYRKSVDVSLKISTQLNYKTYRTTAGPTIDTPHDYSEVNIATIYTTNKGKYKDRVKEIIRKRLEKAQIFSSPEEFFPENEIQKEKINVFYEKIKKEWESLGKGFRAGDDAYRYARPEYMKSLAGQSKSSSTFSYAGFDQLVHISSGIVRYFLEPASLMYGEMRAKEQHNVKFIDTSTQDYVIRDYSYDFLFKEFDKIELDENTEESFQKDNTLPTKLRNLINALGGAFRKILVSDAAERRIFSIAISGQLDKDVLEVLKLGVRYGYFQESSIGNKEGTGRTRLYILSRRLAPYYKLDPTSFAGYKFITNNALKLAIQNPNKFIRSIENKLNIKDSEIQDQVQLTLFED